MAESCYEIVERSEEDDEDAPDITDTGNFSTALANVFNLLEKYRRTEPKHPDSGGTSTAGLKTEDWSKKEDDDSESFESESSSTESSEEGDGEENPGSGGDDDDDESTAGEESSDTDDDSDFESTDGLQAFTRLDLDGTLKRATHRVNLRKLFKPGQFEALCRFQQNRIIRIENKLTLLLEYNLPLPCEQLIREKIGLPRLNFSQFESSDSDSDEDWGATKKKKNTPIFRGVTEDGSKERLEFVRKYVEQRQTGGRKVTEPSKRKIVKATRQRKIQKPKKPSFEPFRKPSDMHQATADSGEGPSTLRYNTRPKSDVKYTEEYTPEDDHFIFCDDCQKLHVGDCPDHPLTRMKDSEVKIGSINRAKLTCPPGLSVDPSSVKNAGYGVWCDIEIQKNTVFGPYEGDVIKKYDVKNLGKVSEGGYSWEIYKKDKLLHFIDGSNQKTSNWMRYVNCARNEEEQNLIAFQYKGEIYYRAFKDIKANVELFVWYGSHYASQLGIKCKKLLLQSGEKSFKQLKEDLQCKSKSVVRLSGPQQSDDQASHISDRNYATNDGDISGQQETQSEEAVAQYEVLLVKNEFGKWECHVCGKVLSNKPNLELHIMTVHNKVKDFKCDVCGKAFSQKINLRTHQKVHSGERLYKCETCGEKFAYANVLKNHQRTHTGEKPCQCKTCGAKFARMGYLKGHVKTHTGEKPFQCKTCGERFSMNQNLLRHERIHTGEKPFQCKTCGEKFSTSGGLHVHERIHTGEKPFQCKTCGERFRRISHLRRHERIHTGEKTYKCEDCGKRFTRSSSLKSHSRTQHSSK